MDAAADLRKSCADLTNEGVCVFPRSGPFSSAPAAATIAVEAALQGGIRKVSVVVADLRGFTASFERVPLGLMWRVLNEYLMTMAEVILDHHGRIQDFVGDGILGVFGAPGLDPDHVWHAVLSALEMQVALRQLSERWKRDVGTSFALGVAVHTGEVFAGAVGSPRQMKYAVVGDPVYTAAKLEEVNRNLGTEIVMSGDALAQVRARVEVQPRGVFVIRGRSHAVEVFEVLGTRHASRCLPRRCNAGVAQPALECPGAQRGPWVRR
jgi:adenylate cyclase